MNPTGFKPAAALLNLPVVNLGRSGYGPQQEQFVLRLHAPRYRLRFIVWQMFEGNDLDDALRFSKWQEAPRPRLTSLFGDYAAASPVRQWLDGTVPRASAQLRHHDGTSARFRIESGLCPQGVDRQRAERLLLDALASAIDFARIHDVAPLVVSIPNARTVLGPYLENPRTRQPLPSGAAPCEGLGEVVRTALAKSAAAFIDTTSALVRRARVDNKHLFFAWDQHMDVDGHAVVAEQIANWVRSAVSGNQD